MAQATEKVGTTYGPSTEVVDGSRALAFARATNDENAAYGADGLVPPLFVVVPTWTCLTEALSDMLPSRAAAMIVHGEQDMRFARPLVADQVLTTHAEAFNLRPGRSGTRCGVRLVSRDAATGEVMVDQYVTMFVREMTGGAAAGPDLPDHGFPAPARHRLVAVHQVHVDADQPSRYARASGDHNPIHLDADVARSVGLPGPIVHGLCSMAMVARSVVAVAADGDPTRLRRLAVRFADVVAPGDDLVTSVYDVPGSPPERAGGSRAYAFESHCSGRLVLSHGRAEVGS